MGPTDCRGRSAGLQPALRAPTSREPPTWPGKGDRRSGGFWSGDALSRLKAGAPAPAVFHPCFIRGSRSFSGKDRRAPLLLRG